MFTANGQPVKNPQAYVASIERNGYSKPLFTEDGEEIRDPVGFLAKLERTAGLDSHVGQTATSRRKRKQSSQADEGEGEWQCDCGFTNAAKNQICGGNGRMGCNAPRDQVGEVSAPAGEASVLMFKEDGTQIKNPAKYVASIQKNGYTAPLFSANGDEIRNPVAFLAGKQRRDGDDPRQEPARKRRKGEGGKGGGKGGGAMMALPAVGGMYKADGTMIEKPSAYVAAIERNGYTHSLFTANGQEIRNPVNFLASMEKRGGSGVEGAHYQAFAHEEGLAEPGLYKGDGTKIMNPEDYIAKTEAKGYSEPLFNAAGKEIRNPLAYVASLDRTADSLVPMFKADGTQIKKPEAYVAKCEQQGYSEPLFNTEGEEIRNPLQYLDKAKRKNANNEAITQRATKQSSIRLPPLRSKAVKAERRESNPAEKEKGIFKANGAKIKNPSAYVANFESRGQKEELFNAHGEEIKNPVAYVAKMLENESRNESRNEKQLVPKTRGTKVTYYSKLGNRSPGRIDSGGIKVPPLGDRLRSALTNGMRARATQIKEEIGVGNRRPARR